MNRHSWILLFAVIGVAAGQSAQSKATFPIHEIEIDGPANCRDKPKGKVLQSISNGTKAKAIGCTDRCKGWYHLSIGKVKCWTHSKNVKDYLDYPTEKQNALLDSLETVGGSPAASGSTAYLLEHDPCFLVEHPSDEKTTVEAKRRCHEKSK